MERILPPLTLAFGLTPFNRLNLKSNTFIDCTLMVLMPVFYLGCYYMVAFRTYGVYHLPQCDSICRLSNSLFVHLGCFLYVSIALLALYRRKNFFTEFEKYLADIDDLLLKCQKLCNDNSVVLPNMRLYTITLILLCALFGFNIIYDVREMFLNYNVYFFIGTMVTTFPYFAASVAQGQFIYYVAIIAHRFKQINNLFEKINQECEKKNAPIAVFDIETEAKNAKNNNNAIVALNEKGDDFCDSSDDTDDDDKNDSSINGVTHASDNSTSEANLPELFKLHDKVLALSVITNAEFGPQCVPYMAACFAISIFGIFLETKVIFIVSGKSHLLDYVVFIYILWSLSTIVVAYLVLRFCCNTNGYSKQSAMIVHEIMQKKPNFMLGNDFYYNKMKSFTLQFLHWEGYFQFNGIGLFALDYTFIFSTVSAATSYLIVLLQFDMSTILKNEGLV